MRPEGLELHPQDDGLVVWTLDLDGIEIEMSEDDPADSWKGEPAETEVDPSVLIPAQSAAAIIRDKAVWWLVRRLGEGTAKTGTADWGLAAIMYTPANSLYWIVGPDTTSVDATDPTEALYLACCKVLKVDP